MKAARSSSFAVLLHATLLSVAAVTSPLYAGQRQSFAYTMKMTPEQGPTDPAIDKRFTTDFASCQKLALTTQENAVCFEGEFVRQDAVLNRTWGATIARLPVKAREALLSAQRKWVAERDPFCKSISDGFNRGTIAPLVYSDCRVEQSIRRTMWLEKLN